MSRNVLRKGRILKLAEGRKEQEEEKSQAFQNMPSAHPLASYSPQFYEAPVSMMITIPETSQSVHTWLKLN